MILKPQEDILPGDRFERVPFEELNNGDFICSGKFDGTPNWKEVYQITKKSEGCLFLVYEVVPGGELRLSPYTRDVANVYRWVRRVEHKDYLVDQEPQEDEETL